MNNKLNDIHLDALYVGFEKEHKEIVELTNTTVRIYRNTKICNIACMFVLVISLLSLLYVPFPYALLGILFSFTATATSFYFSFKFKTNAEYWVNEYNKRWHHWIRIKTGVNPGN
ncbi:hypothetical protein J2S74_003010 [Evansella vedderi]|uniref:DUF4231 domain-containing protein n=1 Tax=Evansella vedderi TaxID=38282 RepID=A0ABT9ZWN5_9BACI|nr:hypothetical protein [Evansella vedderi]MDQ0255628.1 hypothetical protein [Evansella vedderi]